MSRRSLSVLSAVAVLSALIALAVIESTADAGARPFVPVPAAGSISALNNAPLLARPNIASHVGADFQPADGRFYSLGAAGYAWHLGQDVCVVMHSGSGGCFTQFSKPVQLYLTGDETSSGTYSDALVEGVVPDSVTGLTIQLSDGTSVDTVISGNAFAVPVPAGVGVSGYSVTLRNGKTEQDSDPIGVPNPAGK